MARIRIHHTNSNLSLSLSNENIEIEIELAQISSDETSSLVGNTVNSYFTVS